MSDESALSRRHFMYGTTAATADAVFLRGTAARPRPAPSPATTPTAPTTPTTTAATAATAAAGSGFTLIQAGPQLFGTGSVTLTMPAASTAGTLLAATVLSTAASGTFTVPDGWRLAKAVPCAAGRAEIWYYPGTPPSPGNPGGIASAAFTDSGGGNCRGAMSEFAMPGGTMPVFDATGQASGAGGGSFGLTAASGNVAGDLGIAMVADFFSAGVGSGGAWTAPSGWTELRHLGNGAADPWAGWYNASLPAGTQSLSADFGFTAGETGWAFAFAAIRAVAFQPIWLSGGEMITMVALDPTGTELIMGGDVEGLWRTADFGDHWQPSQDGLTGQNWRCTAFVAWSQLEPGAVYAGVGKTGNDGGFLVSADGGVSWSMRSAGVQFRGNAAGSPPRPGGTNPEPQDADRSVGDLLAQDPAGGFLYAATYSGGVARSSAASSPPGTDWAPAGLAESGFYPRALVMNPANSDELWAGTWDSDGTGAFGGVWHCTTARTATSTSAWSQLAGFPAASGNVHGTTADLKIIGGYLYAACPELGIFRHQIGTSTGWTSLNGGGLVGVPGDDSGQWWTSLDGFVDASGNHQVFAACGKGVKVSGNPNHTNVVLITITPAGTASWTDLTGQASIELATLPPDGQGWWRDGSSFTYWLGGGAFVNPHVLSDPGDRNRLYVTGAGGFFRTGNALAAAPDVSWTTAVSGAPMFAAHLIVPDPGDGDHVIIASSDFTQTDLTDPTGWDTAKVTRVNTLPGSGNESHAVAFGPNAAVYTGVNTKYGMNAGGNVYWRAAGDTTFAWNDTGYGGAVGGNAPMGLFAGTDAGQTYLVAVAQGAGMYRAVLASAPNTWQWTLANNVIGTSGNVGQHCPIVTGTTAGHLYCFDRGSGIWRSTDFGVSWTMIWPVTDMIDTRSGWLAANPAVGGELWASTNGGLYKLSGAGTGTVGDGITLTKINSIYFPNGAGGIAFAPAGSPYAVSLNGGAQPSAALLTSADGGATWTDAGGPAVGSYASWPGCLAMTTAGLLLLASDDNVGIYGTPTLDA